MCVVFFFSSRRRHTRCALVTGVQTCALPILDRSKRRSVPQVMPAPVLWTPYCGAAPAPGEWIARWNLDPVLLAAFVFGIAFYFLRSRQPENRQQYFGKIGRAHV